MKTLTVALTLFALAALAAGMTLPAIGQTAAPASHPLVTGHHDRNTQSAGYTLSHGTLMVASDVHRSPLSDTSFNNNVTGLSLSRSTAMIYGGQFSHNTQDGILADGLGADYGATITVCGGQFDSNRQSGLHIRSASATVTAGQFIGNAIGLVSDDNSTVHVGGGFFTNNNYGLKAGHFSSISLTGGTFSNNTQADLWADDGTIVLLGTFRQAGAACSGMLTGSGALDVLFPGSPQWQTLQYKTTNGGEIVLAPIQPKVIALQTTHGHPRSTGVRAASAGM